jgi:hypothetical protein
VMSPTLEAQYSDFTRESLSHKVGLRCSPKRTFL